MKVVGRVTAGGRWWRRGGEGEKVVVTPNWPPILSTGGEKGGKFWGFAHEEKKGREDRKLGMPVVVRLESRPGKDISLRKKKKKKKKKKHTYWHPIFQIDKKRLERKGKK